MRNFKVVMVVGARPNFMKVAPLWRAFGAYGNCECVLVHTGQHHDELMGEVFLRELGLPEPAHRLGVHGGSPASQIARTMLALEPVLLAEQPDCVLVVGDVNATLASALAAVKAGFPVAHVEAGLRCGDRDMPEELNRWLVDGLSSWRFATEARAMQNLAREAHDPGRSFLVGHVMVDNLLHELQRLDAEEAEAGERSATRMAPYGVVTLHRASTVDDPAVLSGVLDALGRIASELPLYFPVHPRTRAKLPARFLAGNAGITLLPPLAYRPFLKLWRRASVVLTDSGGLQEETTALGVPCLTLRENTERPITVEEGSNLLGGIRRDDILAAWRKLRARRPGGAVRPPLWDGKAAPRIASILLDSLAQLPVEPREECRGLPRQGVAARR